MRLKSYVGHRVRELALYPQIMARSGSPKVLFFPWSGPEGFSLLRVYNIAEGLAAKGWKTLVVPKQLELSQRARVVRLFDPDILVFQKCRHPLNDADHAFGKPFVLDLDDADWFDDALHDRMVRTVSVARGVIAGSDFVADWCGQYNPDTTVIWTGAPVTDAGEHHTDHADRAPILTWAQADPLGYMAELELVRDFLRRLREAGAEFTFRLYGVQSDKYAEELRRQFDMGPLELVPPLSYDRFCRSLQEVAIGLSPIIPQSDFSRGKSFGKILAYLDAKVPVISSDEADHARFFEGDAGLVSNDLDQWVSYARDLLSDPVRRERVAGNAFRLFRQKLSLSTATNHVADFLQARL